MAAPVYHNILHNTFWLSANRCLYWEEEQALILSDLHLGKTGHFRKAGIAIPQHLYKEDLQRLFHQIQFYQPQQLIIVGDLFHSYENKEMDLFMRWRNDIPGTAIHLIKGNHDILQANWYTQAGIQVSSESLTVKGFCFLHDQNDQQHTPAENTYYFSGHIHPGVVISSKVKQSLRFPCFYFGKQHAILPAFGKFTGLAIIKPKPADTVYAIVNQSVIKLS